MEFELKAKLVEKMSKKGEPYTVLEIQLTDTCKKNIFLESAELELLKMNQINDLPEDWR